MNKKTINPFYIYLFIILYLEIILKYKLCEQTINIGLIYTLLSTIFFSLILTIITKIFPKLYNRIIAFILIFTICIYFEVQLIFFKLFSVPFSFSTISLANQATDFVSIIIDALKDNLIFVILLFLPFLIFSILNPKINYERYHKHSIASLILMLITSYLSTVLIINLPKNELSTVYKLYYNEDNPLMQIDTFGLLTYTKIDIKRQIFSYDNEIIIDNLGEIIDDETQTPDYGYNLLEINFDNNKNKEIESLNNYFNNATPTNKSEYTGLFKGKNLIFILAEGFNEIAVDKERTPTLYKLTNSGFVFNNFYSPVFLSTTGGEFQATTGLIPTQETLKLWKSKKPTISYALGNAFNNLGYTTNSYHNWTYSYYKRDVTMKTLGFNNYLACGNGLEKRIDCKWLPSDIDMIKTTTEDYLKKDEPFATYYVTVSGHSPYNKNDNIAKKYIDLLEDKPYSESIKYYLAAQIELDRMLEELINTLEENDKLDDTVIALVGDHYPYTLSTDEINEVNNTQKDDTIEVNHSNFILWNNTIKEPIIIDKVGSQIDVLPTILNLFDIEYDSRLIVGKDILSDNEGLAIFSNRSWVSDYGYYDSSKRKFTLKEGKTLENEQEYINKVNNKVANAFSISKMLVNSDYYNFILNNRGD